MSVETRAFLELRGNLSLGIQEDSRIELPGRGALYNFHDRRGIETSPLLAKDHTPRVTKFDTVILSEAFDELREKRPEHTGSVEVIAADPSLLFNISTIANLKGNGKLLAYQDSPSGQWLRRAYLESMAAAAKEFFKRNVGDDEVIVPVVRCGENLAGKLGIKGFSVEVKRLAFANGNLGAGINLPEGAEEVLSGKKVTLLEGVVASGSTAIAVMAAIRNAGIKVQEVSCTAVIVCPEGAKMTEAFRDAYGFNGVEKANYVGGYLDKNWYVRWHREDILFDLFEQKPGELVGAQVLGDGGDLTSI